VDDEILPLNLAMEWANFREARQIHLFRHRPPHAPDRIRLDHVVFHERELPCEIECQDYKTVQTPKGAFLPLDGLLTAMYRSGDISRPVFETLDELAAVVPLQSRVSHPILSTGLLVPQAEARGFRLNALFQESGRVLAQFAWESGGRRVRFHACLASFQPDRTGRLDSGEWVAERETGLCQVLAHELHRLVPGNPHNLLSKAGLFLISQRLQQALAAPSR
jgi:hypothetical protein